MSATSCDDLLSFEVDRDIPEQVVPGNPIGGLLPGTPLLDAPLSIDLEAATKAMGTGPASEVRLKSLTLDITSPDGETWAFLDSIRIKIRADGEPEKEIARLEPVPGRTAISVPPVKGVNLIRYVEKGAVLTATATGHAPKQEVHYTGHVVVTIII